MTFLKAKGFAQVDERNPAELELPGAWCDVNVVSVGSVEDQTNPSTYTQSTRGMGSEELGPKPRGKVTWWKRLLAWRG